MVIIIRLIQKLNRAQLLEELSSIVLFFEPEKDSLTTPRYRTRTPQRP